MSTRTLQALGALGVLALAVPTWAADFYVATTGSPAVDVDVSAVLTPGVTYEVRNGQSYLAAPVVSGTYTGGTIAFPMSAGSAPALPLGPGTIEPGGRSASLATASTLGALMLALRRRSSRARVTPHHRR